MLKDRIGLLVFPGSNCDQDCVYAFEQEFGVAVTTLWYEDNLPPSLAGVVIPGGFSFGDYLRGGAIASHLPIVSSLREFASKGGAILGICNGFQILTESGILPGVLLKNSHGSFICQQQRIRFQNGVSVYQKTLEAQSLSVPISHGEGRFYIDQESLKKLYQKGQVVCTYEGANPNGSVDSIAGVCSENGKVLGMMPHPERAVTSYLEGGSVDGKKIIEAFLATAL